jgi:acetyl-CoA carboxylase carboxyl transferase subunit alpha
MKIAEKFGRPVISFIDLPGAYPGVGAEERGQAEAIARNLLEMSRLRVPTLSVITGEGGSGGALALAVSDRVLILGNAVYSVISPEQCAVIMWRDAAPADGAHTDPEASANLLADALKRHLAELKAIPIDDLVAARQNKFRNIAQYYTEG